MSEHYTGYQFRLMSEPTICFDCNHDTHTCPGCGEPLPHGIGECPDCWVEHYPVDEGDEPISKSQKAELRKQKNQQDSDVFSERLQQLRSVEKQRARTDEQPIPSPEHGLRVKTDHNIPDGMALIESHELPKRVTGYRDQGQEQINLVNEVKNLEIRVGNVFRSMHPAVVSLADEQARGEANRQLALARTHLEEAFMHWCRAVWLPENPFLQDVKRKDIPG